MSVLPFDQRDGFIWMNGNLVPGRTPSCMFSRMGLHYASCVFEGERAYDGRIFNRASIRSAFRNFGANLLDFEIPYSVTELE